MLIVLFTGLNKRFILILSFYLQPWRSIGFLLDVRGSVHHSKIHTEKSNKMQQCMKIYYSILIWSSTCFGRHTAHHQEPKTALAVSGFA